MWQSKRNNVAKVIKRQEMAFRLREALCRLGVTFIKLGQFLSLRSDILPVDLVQELSLLQDRVPPFCIEVVRAIIEEELRCPLGELFQYFENQPVASASIGQVHKAILRDGRTVAVKIRRKNLQQVIDQDLAFMRFAIKLGKVFYARGNWQSWAAIVDEFDRGISVEMDYLQEGRNADRLRQVLRLFPAIVVPRVVWRYTTKAVIVEEFCQGIKIDQVLLLQNFDRKRLCGNLVEAYLEQVIVHGFFHADPHAGNLAVAPTGQLIIYDFGMTGYLTDCQRLGVTNLVASVVKNNISGFVDALEQIGFVRLMSKVDREYLEEIILPVWRQCRLTPSADVDLSGFEKEMLLLSQYFCLPANIVSLIRMAVALEAIVRKLSPDFNFAQAAAPYFRKFISM